MNVFVTGGTGFIGTRLVKKLLQDHSIEHIYLLVRSASLEKASLRFADEIGEDPERKRLHFVIGNLREPMFGISPDDKNRLTGCIDHFFHLGAIYDLMADREAQLAVNVQGTRYAVQFCQELQVGTFHLISSIAAAGFYPGVFREDMFEEAVGLSHPYFSTKHESERIVRSELTIPYRIYRPAFVVGDSKTGEIDKIDGPYYLFNTLKSIRHLIPEWMPLLGIEGGRFNIVPVDFVVDAMHHLAFLPDQNGRTFHLTDREHWRFGDLLNLFAKAAHAPEFGLRINTRLINIIPAGLRKSVMAAPGVSELIEEFVTSLGIPRDFFQFINWPTRYDNRHAETLLLKAGISVPPLPDYIGRLWDYWERNLDPDLFAERTLEENVKNKVVLITGGSSGIGKATAIRLAKAGAIVVICARDPQRLKQAHEEIERLGGKVYSYAADITQEEEVIALFEMIQAETVGLSFLINNAGHSIRRSVMNSLERLHDFERTMNLNYLAAVSVTLKALAMMERNHGGQVINISSIGVLSNSPRFSAYVASKSALEAFSRCAAAELVDHKIAFTNINMPLVRTPMIAPTALYDNVPTLTPEEAADLVVEAILKRPERLSTKLGKFAEIIHTLSPSLQRQILNVAFRLFPERTTSVKSGSEATSAHKTPSPAQVIFASLMKGVHW